MLRNLSILFLGAMIATGCATKEEPPVTMFPQVQPLTSVPGTYATESAIQNLRTGESVKAYTVGRLVDQYDPTVMHEKTVIYRIENGNSWNLQKGMPTTIPFGGISKKTPAPRKQVSETELKARIADMRKQEIQVRALKELAQKKLITFRKGMDKVKQTNEKNTELANALVDLRNQYFALQKKHKQLQADLDAIISYRSTDAEEEDIYKYTRRNK